jgi:solute carrier family 50 protein (sugar transporter)
MANGLLITLRVLTFVTALAVGLSPYPEIRRVHKQRDAGDVSIFPVVTLFGNSYLWCGVDTSRLEREARC